jgi:uncharacterized protein
MAPRSMAPALSKLHVLGTNFWAGRLPEGCQLCREGAKMVLYLTGECQSQCWYCPVARERMYVDRAFANEREFPAGAIEPVLEEARAMKASGVGITGGDPMTKPERVADYCRALKSAFGPAFHIHLYTQNVFDPAWLPRLKEAGLDEIRFHPPVGWWTKMDHSPWATLVPAARAAGLRTGLEVPAIPHKEEALIQFCQWADAAGAEFVNLNELEFSEANVEELTSRGHTFQSDASNVVAGGMDTARKVVEAGLRARLRTTVHFCASTYKDSVQLRKRLQRRIQTVGRPLDGQTPDGTLLFGVIEAEAGALDVLHERLTTEFEVPVPLVQINRDLERIEIAPWVLERIHDALGLPGRCFVVEVHPTATRLEVERTPLPYPDGNWDADEPTPGAPGPN